MNGVLKKLVTVLVSLVLLAYVGYQAYLSLYMPVKTQQAAVQTVQDTIAADGYVVNDEHVLNGAVSGIIDYSLGDGERVSKNGVVAYVYSNSQQAENERKLRQLDEQIKQLQIDNMSGDNMAIDINVLNSEIDQKFSALTTKARSSYVEGISSLESDFLNLLNQKQLATGKASNFNAKLQQLTAKRQSLANSQGSSRTSITSPFSGYFVSRVDGYENRFPAGNISSITTSQVNNLLSAKPSASQDAIGKVISTYEWYIVCVLSGNDALKLNLNAQVNLSIPFSAENDMPATVAVKNRDENGNYAVALKCNYMTGNLAVLRSSNINIIVNQYKGIKVDNDNVHVVGGTKGVYILEGNTVKFKKLDVAYAGDGYMISNIDSSDSSRLQLYDEVIVEGRNIYDGKIVK